VEGRVEQAVPERLQADFAALLQRQVGRVDQALEVPQVAVLEQVVLMVTVAQAAITHPALPRARVGVGFWGQVEIVLILLPLEREVAVLAVRAALCLQAQLFVVAARAVHRAVLQAIPAVVLAREVRAGVRAVGWAQRRRAAELFCMLPLREAMVL
jgi:hypothetical protein